MLLAWCFSTRASVATVLTMHPCVSRCLRVKDKFIYWWPEDHTTFDDLKNQHFHQHFQTPCLILNIPLMFGCQRTLRKLAFHLRVRHYGFLAHDISTLISNKHWLFESWTHINTLRQWQTGRHFADNIFKHIFLNENVGISIQISPKFFPKGPIYNNPALLQIMAWCQTSNKPLSKPMMV